MAFDLEKNNGKNIHCIGTAEISKAGSFLLCNGVPIWMSNHEWSAEENGKRLRVRGMLSKRSTPLFPQATQDQDGGWTQGVGYPHWEKEVVFIPTEEWTLWVEQVEFVEDETEE